MANLKKIDHPLSYFNSLFFLGFCIKCHKSVQSTVLKILNCQISLHISVPLFVESYYLCPVVCSHEAVQRCSVGRSCNADPSCNLRCRSIHLTKTQGLSDGPKNTKLWRTTKVLYFINLMHCV